MIQCAHRLIIGPAGFACPECGLFFPHAVKPVFTLSLPQTPVEALRGKLEAFLPGWNMVSLHLRHGRWHAILQQGLEYEVSDLLKLEHHARKQVANLPMLPLWRRKLTDKTAREVEAMCRRLLRGNPNNQFVREQYPDLFEAITAEQQMATTHSGTHHGTQA